MAAPRDHAPDDLTKELVALLGALKGYSRIEAVMRLRALAVVGLRMDIGSLLTLTAAIEEEEPTHNIA